MTTRVTDPVALARLAALLSPALRRREAKKKTAAPATGATVEKEVDAHDASHHRR